MVEQNVVDLTNRSVVYKGRLINKSFIDGITNTNFGSIVQSNLMLLLVYSSDISAFLSTNIYYFKTVAAKVAPKIIVFHYYPGEVQ